MFDFRLKKHTQYIPENLEKAVEAVLSGSMSQCRAAVVFGVSQPTISRFSAVPGRLRTTLESVLLSGTDDMNEQSIREGDQVELHQNTGVYCNLWQLNKICQASVKEPSKMIRCLLELYFDDQYLADHCAKGRLPFGSSNPADSRPAIDSVILGAIRGSQAKSGQKQQQSYMGGKSSSFTINPLEECHNPWWQNVTSSDCLSNTKQNVERMNTIDKTVSKSQLSNTLYSTACTSRLELSAHYKGHQRVCCELCPKSFTSSSGLYMHRKTHHGTSFTVCKLCGKKFGSASRLRRHLSSHSSEKPYHCERCQKSYKHKDTLDNHVCS
ncbi:KRAB [Mytilus coruscus]|uniref:KRAB n=1 Tax=Mytilus coruscus TaxID=42192 RepID=A0A6J8B1C4_MYTCO|nr:KRAB [Mytilus coruscus]